VETAGIEMEDMPLSGNDSIKHRADDVDDDDGEEDSVSKRYPSYPPGKNSLPSSVPRKSTPSRYGNNSSMREEEPGDGPGGRKALPGFDDL